MKNLLLHVATPLSLVVLCSATYGQVPSASAASGVAQIPAPSTYAQLIGILVGTCPIALENALLKFQMKRITAAESVAEVRTCVDAKTATSESEYASRVRPRLTTLIPECQAALSALRADALAHFEGFSADPLETPGRQVRRVSAEAGKLRAQATKARLACE